MFDMTQTFRAESWGEMVSIKPVSLNTNDCQTGATGKRRDIIF